MQYTKELADFCSQITLKNLPAEVVHKARLCILDYLANVYGSLELDAVTRVVSYIRCQDGPSRATARAAGITAVPGWFPPNRTPSCASMASAVTPFTKAASRTPV